MHHLASVDIAFHQGSHDCNEAMFPFISDPGLPASLLLIVLIGQAILKKDLMDSVMRNVPAIFLLDDLLDAPCSVILLFVDFQVVYLY